MKRLLSFLTLFVLICMSSSAVPLSKSLYNSANCELHLGATLAPGATIYGNGSVPAAEYADLGAYSKLVINSSGGGLRLLFNRVGDTGNNYLEISRASNTQYFSFDGVATLTIDLDAIKANTGSAHLNVIKNDYGYGDITVNSIAVEMAGEVTYPKTWDFTSLSIDGNHGTFVKEGNTRIDGSSPYWINNAALNNAESGLPESQGLKFDAARGQIGVMNGALYWNSATIHIPDLKPGNVITIVAGRHSNTTGYNIVEDGNVTSVNVGTNPTTTTYTVNKSGEVTLVQTDSHIHLQKIIVTQTTPTNIYYTDATFGNTSGVQSSFRNGAVTIPAADIVGNTSYTLNFQLRDGNNSPYATALVAGTALTGTATNADINKVFSITSSDASVIDVSNASVEIASEPKMKIVGLNFKKYGTATLTLTYIGHNGMAAPTTISTVVTITGIQRYIGFSGRGGTNVTEGYIDEAQFRQFLRLFTNEARTGGAYFDTSVGFVVTADTSKVVEITNQYVFNNDNARYDVYMKPLSVGYADIHVFYPGDATQLPCEWDYQVHVKKHPTHLEFSTSSALVNYGSDGTVINAADLPTLIKKMDVTDANPNGSTPTYTVKYSSSDPDVATVDENTGVVTMHNSGVTVITATVVTTKTINGNVVEAYIESHDSYTLTVKGSQNQTGVLVWLSQLNPATGSPQGGKVRGSYWTQKNVEHMLTERKALGETGTTLFNPDKETSNQVNLITEMPYGNEIIVNASMFTNLDWLGYNAETGQYEGTWTSPRGFNPENNYQIQYSTHFFRLKADADGSQHFFTGNEEGLKMRDGDRYEWRYNRIQNYQNYIPAAAQPQTWTTTLRNGKTASYNNVWMSNIEYSVSDPNLLDGASEGERIQAGGSEGQCWVKEYSIRPYPPMDEDGNVTGDSLTIYAKISGGGNVNPIIISQKVKIIKGSYNLTTEPKEGYVTEGEWVIPYVNIPDIKLKDIKKITVWFDDPEVGKVECEISTNENGQVIYTLYEKDVTSSEWIGTHYDSDSKLDLVDRIYPKITGLIANRNTTMHIKVESPFYEDQECEYILHVLPDADHPKFHWYANDSGDKVNECIMGRDKGVNKARTIWFGEDDSEVKEMVIYEGDLVHMPGIVGTPNGNDEFSTAGNWNDRTQANPEPGYKYVYGIKDGKVERNADSYYWREGIPNYFFTTGFTRNGNVYTPQGDPLIPTNQATTDIPALIVKSIAEWGQRGDTLMIYGNKAGNLYLWAQDAQTHLCCTPIHLTIKARSEIVNAKRSYLQNMTYPYTWDFEHMDMTNIINDRNANGSNYWELLRTDEEYDEQGHVVSPDHIDYYQANGFFNADYDDKDGNADYRQRWFKDLTTGEGYMPQFYGLMLNISGLQYWTQKYNRFRVAADGSHIAFIGGPHYLQLPGFGINPTGTYGQDETYSYEKFEYNSAGNRGSSKGMVSGKDGTRQNDNIMGGWHSHVNTINNSFVDGYGFTSTGDAMNASAFDGKNAGTDEAVHNRKVRFVIVASGKGEKGAQSSQFHIGGKSMMDQALDENRINWAYSTNDSKRKGTDGQNYSGVNNSSQTEDNYNKENIPGYSKYNLSDKRTLYAFDLDPYDPEYQDHIYLMFNNDVKVYWMGISTEPRDMRSDYDNFTFSYPKDIDLDKTNDLMYTATSDGVRSKSAIDGTRSVPHHKMVNDGGADDAIQFQAFYASGYDRANETLQLERFPYNRIPAGEGALIYPYVGSKANYGSTFSYNDQSVSEAYNQSGTAGMEQSGKKNRTVVTFLGFRTETVVKDGKTYNVQVPIYGQKTVKYQYQYLPTYFIANAQNVANYGGDHGTKTDSKYEFGYQYGFVTPLSAGLAPTANTKNGVIANASTNLLRGSVYTTHIDKDYTDGNNVRWINLGLTNEYIARTLEVEDHKTLLGQLVDNATGQQMSLDTYYELIGPKFVRFYRANKDQNMKNRRAYLTLTWDEYNVNTDGKRGVSYQQLIGNQDPGMWYGYYGTDESLWEASDGTNSTNQQFSQHYYGVMLAFKNKDNQGETIVSDDGGFVDGISEVQTTDNDGVEFYNLNGMRVNTPRKGIYIMNGRKVTVK